MKADRPLLMFTIYENPTDYPGKFVARRFAVTAAGVMPEPDPLAVVDTIEEARAAIPDREGLVCMRRNPSDEPQIVETWL